jgi:hypothetical protein
MIPIPIELNSALSVDDRIELFPKVASSADGTGVTAIWDSGDSRGHTLQAASSKDGGITWSDPAVLSAAVPNPLRVRRVVSSANGATRVAFWDDSDVSNPDGNTWVSCCASATRATLAINSSVCP